MNAILIVGLGNPGEQFSNTRHNIGREIVQAFQKRMAYAPFSWKEKWHVHLLEGKVGKEKFVLAIPDTFMNKTGNTVASLVRFFKVAPANLFLVHDDADIPLGSCKLSFGKHSAGHKGVESVMRAVKTIKFWRVRIGIAGKRDIPAEKLVLKKFSKDEQHIIKKIFKKTLEALESIMKEGPEKTMNTYNQIKK